MNTVKYSWKTASKVLFMAMLGDEYEKIPRRGTSLGMALVRVLSVRLFDNQTAAQVGEQGQEMEAFRNAWLSFSL
jgi:hypothetical protein